MRRIPSLVVVAVGIAIVASCAAWRFMWWDRWNAIQVIILALTMVIIWWYTDATERLGEHSQALANAASEQVKASQDQANAALEQVKATQEQVQASLDQVRAPYRPFLQLTIPDHNLQVTNVGLGAALMVHLSCDDDVVVPKHEEKGLARIRFQNHGAVAKGCSEPCWAEAHWEHSTARISLVDIVSLLKEKESFSIKASYLDVGLHPLAVTHTWYTHENEGEEQFWRSGSPDCKARPWLETKGEY